MKNLRPELQALIAKAQASFDAMTPEEQAAHRRAQRKSYVIGEMMFDRPDMTREEAERIYSNMCREHGYVE